MAGKNKIIIWHIYSAQKVWDIVLAGLGSSRKWSSMNSIVTPAVRRGFWAAFRDFNWEACSRFMMACTDTRLPWRPRSRICRLCAVMWRFLKVTRWIERSTLSVVNRGLPLHGLSITSCVSLYRSRSLDMVLWLTPQNCTIWLTVTIEFIDDQSCPWAVAHYWHGEILANFCWTPPLFSGSYLLLWSWHWDTISVIWKGIDTPINGTIGSYIKLLIPEPH